jgi:predicted AlkP superfamily phosphohydrolase/phosphomutase
LTRVLVIGLDGGTFDVLLPLVKGGDMPNLAGLMKGTWSELTSTIPPFTAPAWATFMTGQNPGEHGVTGLIVKDGRYRARVANSTDVRSKDLWTYLSEKSKRVVVLNVPLTYPVKPLNGVLVSGFLTPPDAHDYTYPRNLLEDLGNPQGGYKLYADHVYEEGIEKLYISDISAMTRMRADLAERLLGDKSWDFFMIVFEGPDQLQHGLWRHLDFEGASSDDDLTEACRQYYRELDKIVGEIITMAGTDTLKIIASDHGFGPLKRFIHVNSWLIQKGFLKLKSKPITMLKRLLYSIGITPLGIYNMLLKLHLARVRAAVGRQQGRSLASKLFLSLDDVDWARTTAFSLGSMGQIFINTKPEYSQGIVDSKDSYLSLRKSIMEQLAGVRDPETGEEAVERLLSREDVYHGKMIKQMPDVVVVPKRGFVGFEELEFATNKVFTSPRGISGTHRMNGILVVDGPMTRALGKTEPHRIEDVFPTILCALGVPIPKGLDGHPMTELFESEFLTENPVRFEEPESATTATTSEEDDKKIMERLRSLGYVG